MDKTLTELMTSTDKAVALALVTEATRDFRYARQKQAEAITAAVKVGCPFSEIMQATQISDDA